MNWNNGHLSDITDVFRTFIGHKEKNETYIKRTLKEPKGT